MSSKISFPVILAGFLALSLLSIPNARAGVIVHAEANVSNIQITPATGDLLWYFDPWYSVTAAGAFDDLSGWDQAYDDDFDLDGESAASASTPYVDANGTVSANAFTINVDSHINDPTGDLSAFSAYSFGELYNLFEITESNPVDVTFALDFSVLLQGQATGPLGYQADYGVVMEISDGITDWILDVSHELIGTGDQIYTDAGTLASTFTLQPFTLYSIDIIADPNIVDQIPEPASLSLLGLGLAGLAAFRRRPSNRSSTAG